MKKRLSILPIVILLAVGAFIFEAKGETTSIIVNGADATVDLPTVASSPLNTLIANVAPRFVVEFANTIKYYNVTTPSLELLSLLGQIGDRFIIQYANANVFKTLAYPIDQMNDHYPPIISDLSVNLAGIVQWDTDEVATSLMQYGTSPGEFIYTLSDPLYFKLHQLPLTGLVAGTKYYYKVVSVDRSGNIAESAEGSFTASLSIYLPIVIRK